MSDDELTVTDEGLATVAISQFIDAAGSMLAASVTATNSIEKFLEELILEVEADLGIPEANIKSTREILGALDVDTETIKYTGNIGIWIPWTQVHKLYKLLIKLITEEDLSDESTK